MQEGSEDENSESPSVSSSSCNDENDDHDENGSGQDASEGEDTWSKVFSAMSPQGVTNLVQACKAHELFPLFEDHEAGSSEHQPCKSGFGADPKHDLVRWNSWLESHGETSSASSVLAHRELHVQQYQATEAAVEWSLSKEAARKTLEASRGATADLVPVTPPTPPPPPADEVPESDPGEQSDSSSASWLRAMVVTAMAEGDGNGSDDADTGDQSTKPIRRSVNFDAEARSSSSSEIRSLLIPLPTCVGNGIHDEP